MGQFTVTRLVNQRAVVTGEDVLGVSGSTTVSTAEWDELNGKGQFAQASAAFDQAVEEFFAPISEAAEALEAAGQVPDTDESTYVVINEGVAHTKGEDRVIALLSKDSVILRLIEEGDSDRLIWVGTELEVTAVDPDAGKGSE